LARNGDEVGIKAALRTFLLSQSAVTDLVVRRIHHAKRPRGGTLPAITFYRAGRTSYPTLDGDDGEPTVRIALDCWARTATEAEDVADAVVDALEGEVLPTVWSGYGIGSLTVEEGGQDNYDPDFADEGFHQVSLDVTLTYAEG
jgi:hypothetical protein